MPDLSQFGDIGAFVLVTWIFLQFMKVEGEKRDKTSQHLAEAIQKNTTSTNQLITFMTKLNGSLRKVVEEKKVGNE